MRVTFTATALVLFTAIIYPRARARRRFFHFWAHHRVQSPHHCRPEIRISVFKTRITVSTQARVVEALTKLMSNISQTPQALLLFFSRPSYLLSVPDEPQLSPERDCNVNQEAEGMSVEFGGF